MLCKDIQARAIGLDLTVQESRHYGFAVAVDRSFALSDVASFAELNSWKENS
jgi:hypothetical protein